MFVVDSSQKHLSLDYFGVVKAKYGVMLTKYNNIKNAHCCMALMWGWLRGTFVCDNPMSPIFCGTSQKGGWKTWLVCRPRGLLLIE